MASPGHLVRPLLTECTQSSTFLQASIMTPNQYEAEQLTGLSIRSEEDALAACAQLHQRGPPTVVRRWNRLGVLQSPWAYASYHEWMCWSGC